MNDLTEQFEYIKSVYNDNTKANIIIDNLSHVIMSDLAKTLSLMKTNENFAERENIYFPIKESIYLLNLNISKCENCLTYAQDIEQKYNDLPIEIKNYAFKSKFYAMLRMLSDDICKNMENYANDMKKLHKKMKINKIT